METTTRICALRELIPATPIHPGEMIKDELQAQGVSQRKFVGITGMPYTAFNEIINGHRPTIIYRPLAVIPAFLRFSTKHAKRLRHYSYDEQNVHHRRAQPQQGAVSV